MPKVHFIILADRTTRPEVSVDALDQDWPAHEATFSIQVWNNPEPTERNPDAALDRKQELDDWMNERSKNGRANATIFYWNRPVDEPRNDSRMIDMGFQGCRHDYVIIVLRANAFAPEVIEDPKAIIIEDHYLSMNARLCEYAVRIRASDKTQTFGEIIDRLIESGMYAVTDRRAQDASSLES